MKTPSVAFVLRKNKPRADGACPVFLRATFGRKSRYSATGVSVLPREWNEKRRRVKASCKLAPLHNQRLNDLYQRALAIAYAAGSAEEVIDGLDVGKGTLSSFIEELTAGMTEDGRYWDRMKYTGLLAKLHECLGAPLGWVALTPQALRKFERYLRETRGNAPNTVRREMSRLRTVMNRAIRDGVLKVDGSPFVRYVMPKGEPVEKRSLTLDEVGGLAAVELEWGSRLRVVRDAWLTAFYGGGIRLSDILLLTVDNFDGDRLKLRMQKTGAIHNIELPPVALEVLRPYLKDAHERAMQPPARKPYPYIFGLLQMGDDDNREDVRRRQHRCASKVNRAIKQVALLAGVEPKGLSSHTARRTFADHARREGSIYEVMLLLGHKDPSTTRSYLAAFDTTATDAVTRKMWKQNGG